MLVVLGLVKVDLAVYWQGERWAVVIETPRWAVGVLQVRVGTSGGGLRAGNVRPGRAAAGRVWRRWVVAHVAVRWRSRTSKLLSRASMIVQIAYIALKTLNVVL